MFIVRVQTSQGLKRIPLPNDNSTWNDLKLNVMDLYGVPVTQQQLSTTRLNEPKYITAGPTATLNSLKIQNGAILYLKEDGVAAGLAASPTSSMPNVQAANVAKTFQQSAQCVHGPRGQCLHCVPVETTGEKAALFNTGAKTPLCTHGSGVTCLHCSLHVGNKGADVATWLCNHGENVFCPKCIPKAPEKTDGVVKADKVPYKQFIAEKKALCRYKHAEHMSCVSCADPELDNYAGKPGCQNGHKPYPYGVCLKCAPANANVRVQRYRHCDVASLPPSVVGAFRTRWLTGDPFSQRAAIMFGYYEDEPEASGMVGGIRANVQAMYEPPQESQSAITHHRFLSDPDEKIVHEVADWLGFQPVGWIITCRERKGGAKYKGTIFLSGSEVRQAARFQWRYKNEKGHSRFVTVVLEEGDTEKPGAYQVSDQCVIMERDSIFGKPADPFMMSVRKPKEGEIVAQVIHENKLLKAEMEFLNDAFLVKIIRSAPKVEKLLLKHCDFPARGTDDTFKVYLSKYASETYENKVSDFNALCFLAKKNRALTKTMCELIKHGKGFDQQTNSALDSLMVPYLYG